MITGTRTKDTGTPPLTGEPRPGPGQPAQPKRSPLKSAMRRAGHSSRRQLVPWLLAPVLPGAALITHMATRGKGDAALWAAAVVLALAAFAAWNRRASWWLAAVVAAAG